MLKIFPLSIILSVFFALTVFSVFLSLSETAIIALSRIRLRHMLSRGLKRAQSVQRLIHKMDKFITAILVFNNFANIAISSIITAFFVGHFGYKWGVVLATLCAASFIVVICEITPKVLAIKNTERAALFVAPIMEVLIKVFNPIIFLFGRASDLVIFILRIKHAKKSPLITEEELRLMIEIGKEEGFLSDDEGKMLHRIFEFGDIKVADVMIPKDKMVAVDMQVTQDKLLDIFVEEGHARLPVYMGSKEHIVGIIYARDLLYVLRDKGLFVFADLVHEPYHVPDDMPVSELLKKFQKDKLQIAIVVDQHKKAVGLVTLEDLIEEIVGEIEEVNVDRLLR
ncbi:MAG: hemolysin family protein [Candidatus Omnitrophota bacterium]